MSLFRNKQGEQIDLQEWARLMSDPRYKFIDQDRYEGWLVSTLFDGIDRSWMYGHPGTFETIIFWAPTEDWITVDGPFRYPDEETARRGHAYYLQEVKSGEYTARGTSELERQTNTLCSAGDAGRFLLYLGRELDRIAHRQSFIDAQLEEGNNQERQKR